MNKLTFSILAIFLLFNSLPVQAQNISDKPDWHFFSKKIIPETSSDMPDWVKPLYGTEVNICSVEEAMFDYYNANGGFKRDTYSRFFQRWMAAAESYMDEDGNVRNWSTIELETQQNRAKTTQQNLTKSANNWSFLGPDETYWNASDSNTGSCSWQVNIYAIDIALSNTNIIYAGGETGGLFKTTNKGLDWTFIAKDYNFGGAIQAVSIHPSNPNTVYASTSSNIFKSTDGGTNWTILYTQSGLACTDLEIHPTNTNRIFASTENGLLRSDDAGANWSTILSEEFYDLEFQPGNANQMYALGHDISTSKFVLYKSIDAGLTFSQSMTGWGTVYERSGGKLAVSTANDDYVYAILLTDDNNGGNEIPYLQKSTDGAANWTTIATGTSTAFPMNNGQGYYDLALVVSQTNANHVIVGTQTMYRSTDGGINFTCLSGYCSETMPLHPDVQAAKCVGGDCWIATDGGMNYSTDFFDNPSNFSSRNKGLAGSDMWGYSQAWNEDMFVGGRYHNGNTAWHENYPTGRTLRMGGGESATGWILHGREPKAHFDDIGPRSIPRVISDSPIQDFAFTKHPNKVYGRTTSRILTHPENAAIHFTGEGDEFWRSDDGGVNWTSLNDFGQEVWWFELSRSNPDVIYVFTNSGFHKTTDGGASWTNLTAQLPGGFGYYSRCRVTVDGTDENTLWVLRYNGGNNNKVYKSTNGGASWTNWSTTTLNGQNFNSLVHILGTNGGVYLASIKGSAGIYPAKVYYRNNTDSDWRDCSANLPAGFNPLKLVPFYRDSKVRLAGTMSVWEADFEEQANIIAQPMVANDGPAICLEEIQFECYSILDHTGASWSWSFPGSATVDATNIRNPRVTYNAAGTYTATLTITRGPEMDTKSVQVTVTGSCASGIIIDGGIDSDGDGMTDTVESTTCENALAQTSNVSGANALVTSLDFGGATTGIFYVDLTTFTNCYNTTANLKAFVDLDGQAIQVIEYDHFDSTSPFVSGTSTNTVTSISTAYAQMQYKINGTNLDVIQISNACGSDAGVIMRLNASCWSALDKDGDGIMNHLDLDSDDDGLSDFVESTVCDNTLPQSSTVSGTDALVETLTFGGATSGIFYVDLTSYTNCYGRSAILKAIVDLDNQKIMVADFVHFSGTSNGVTGDGTDEVTSQSNSYAQVRYKLNGTTLEVILVSNACGSWLRLNSSCWSALDRDGNGTNDFLENSASLTLLVDAKAMLQGPYNATNVNMNSNLSSMIPLAHPYGAIHAGTENVTTIPADVVDWVLVELRQPANTVISSRAGFLKKDGSIVDLDGTSSLAFQVLSTGNYFVAVRHRNHLGVMTQAAVPLN